MKRALTGLLAASVLLGTAIPTAFADSSSTSSQWFTMDLSVNGSTLSKPYGIAESDGSTTTTYIPLFYVNQALSKIGYTVSWDGSKHTWSLTTSKTGLDFSSIPVGTGNTSVLVNGTLVKQFNTIVQLDPSGGTSTTYIPIYYVSPLIQALGISAVWNGSSHTWSIGDSSGSSSGSSSSSSSSSSGSSSSGSTNSLTSPTIKSSTTNNTNNIIVTGAASGATLTLYDENGNTVISTTAQSDGTATFYNVAAGSYYVIEAQNGEHSGQSNTVTIAASTPTAPTIAANHSNGVWYVVANNAVPNATLTLYGTNGEKISTATANQYGYATFDSVGSGSYYVIEATSGGNIQSNALTIDTAAGTSSSSSSNSLSTPTISTNANSDTLTVNNVTSGATVTLYNASGSVYSSATANSNGYATFTNVASGTYYAVQTDNGEQSSQSNSVSFQRTSNTPVISVSQSSGSNSATLTVSNVTSGATVYLYQSSGSLYGTLAASSTGYATFNNVSNGSYYAVQTSDGVQSSASNTVSVSSSNLNQPTISLSQNNGVGTIYLSNLTSGATVTLYQTNGSAYSTATADSSGNATFTNVSSGTYYAVQSLNSSQSTQSYQVTVSSNNSTPSTPNAYISSSGNGTGTITVNDVTAGATVSLMNASGSTYSSTTANSSGYATFNNVSSGTYYAIQTWNGYQSARSGEVTVSSSSGNLATPSASVSVSNNVGTIVVSNLQYGATVTLYTSSGNVYQTGTANSGYVTFTNVSQGTYYVVQSYNGYTSAHSNNIAI